MINFDINMFFTALNSEKSIRNLGSIFESTVVDAQENISRNIDLVKQIVSEDTTQQDLTDFFQTVSIFEFSGQFGALLAGLSSSDGTRQYIGERVLCSIACQRTLEHEYMHNISRWKYPNDHRRISPSKNTNLRSRIINHMIEAGHFYDERAYDRVVEHPSPFCLNLFPAQD